MKSCSRCGAPANCVITQTINGKQTKEYLCENCAKTSQLCAFFFGSGFSDQLRVTEDTPEKRCDLCGCRFSDIMESGKVGCPRCYSCFGEQMKGLLREIHGNAVYKKESEAPSSAPENPASPESEEEVLRERLREAITREDYESAALLRDQLNALKGENKDAKN